MARESRVIAKPDCRGENRGARSKAPYKIPNKSPRKLPNKSPIMSSLDIFWLKDKSLTDLGNLPEPAALFEEIIENLEAGLGSFREAFTRLRQNG